MEFVSFLNETSESVYPIKVFIQLKAIVMIFTFDPHALRNLNFQLHKRVQTGEIDKRQGHYLRNAPQQVIDN